MKKTSLKGCIGLFSHYNKLLKIMKISIVLAIVGTMGIFASTYSQETKLSLKLTNATIVELLNEIGKKSEFSFWYNYDELNKNSKISVAIKDQSIDQILELALKNQNLTYEIKDKVIILYKPHNISSEGDGSFQNQKVSGAITDATSGEPLPGVNVMVEGTTLGVVSDVDGRYSIEVPSGSVALIFSYVGYNTEKVVLDNRSVVNVTLLPDIKKLDEVVVIGYGTQRKGDVSSAIATVKAKDFTVGPSRDASELIKGKVAGLSITNGSGDPTTSASINLRGVNSLKGSSSPLVLINGIPGRLDDISPAEIESIDVLKDASAAAIYGTRGANGVIIITTKHASRNIPTSLSYSGYVGISEFTKKAEFLNAEQYRQKLAEGYALPYPDEGFETDWLSEITRKNPITHNHDVSIQGGSAQSNYVVNMNYMHQDGVFMKSNNKEYKASIDVNHYMFKDKLRLNLNVIKGVQKFGSLGDGRSFDREIYRQALIRNPTDRVKDENGNWQSRAGFQYYNPVAMIEETDGDIENEWTRVTGNFMLEPVKGWQTNLMLATNQTHNTRGYSETSKYVNSLKGVNGFASRGDDKSSTNFLELTSRYSKVLGNHNFTILGGYSYQYSLNSGGWVNNYDFPTDEFSYDNIGNGAAILNGKGRISSYKNDNTLVGFFGRLNYGFNNRYNIMASVRREGSSKFGKNYKFGTFPSVSAAWTISNESFMQDVTVFDNLKLRAGYGITGVIPGESYRSLTIFEYSGNFYNNGTWVKGLSPKYNPNPDLRWEKSREYNVGLEFSLMKSRISGSVDIYKKSTVDMLWDYQLPQPPNYARDILANVGEMENKGIEVVINTIPFQKENFEWTSGLTFSHNKNEVISIDNDMYDNKQNAIIPNTAWLTDPVSLPTHRIEPGRSIGDFWGIKSVDIDTDGTWIIEAADGSKVNTQANANLTDANRKYLGNGVPKYRASWLNTFRYKRLELSMVLNGAFDFQILNVQRLFYENPTIKYNRLTSAYDNVYGKRQLNFRQYFVSYYLEDGDYLKIDNLTLRYNFNVSKLKVFKDAKIYTSFSNLATFTKYKGLDPEIDRSNPLSQGNDERDKYPSVRTYTLGIQLTF